MKFDYVVIGSGPSVYRFLLGMQNSGKKIAVVEKNRFGGICPNEGCEPKIFLEGAARATLTSMRLQGKGITQPAKLDWKELIQQKNKAMASFLNNMQSMYEGLGATTIKGEASFVDQHTIEVNNKKITADNFVIATGKKPHPLNIPGHEYLLTSTNLFELEDTPKNVAIIGSGYVGMEFATLLSAAGVKVTVIVRSGQPLEGFYSQHVHQLVDEMKNSLGINFIFNTNVTAVTEAQTGYEVQSANGNLGTFDKVINASGRVPEINALKLDNAGVEYSNRGIKVDKYLTTSANNIYAMGDIVDKTAPALTSTAQFEADYLSALLTNKTTEPLRYPVIGTVTFTFPQLAQAGISIDKAKEDSNYSIKDIDITQGDFFYAGTDDHARLSLVFDKQNHLVGAAEISQTAVDNINALIPVMAIDVDPEVWKEKMIMAFPGLAYKIRTLI